MDKVIDARFERVEKALATLIASISKYNPSPALAQDLVVADQELTDGLSLLSQHQKNTHTLAHLHETSTSLDAQIRDTLILLTSTRTALLETPSSEFPENTNKVEYEELLSYARRISKYTMAPDTRSTGKEETGAQTNGSATPVITVNTNGAANGTGTGTEMALDVPSAENGQVPPIPGVENTQPLSQTALAPQQMQWLNAQEDDRPFVPWPRDEELKMGALARIEDLIKAGIEPENWDPEAEERKEKERLEELERKAEEERVADEERRRIAEERRASAMASGHHGGAASGANKPKAFQLEEFDDDEDE